MHEILLMDDQVRGEASGETSERELTLIVITTGEEARRLTVQDGGRSPWTGSVYGCIVEFDVA